MNRKMNQVDENRDLLLRVSHRKSRGKKAARYLIKCGCCDESVEICYDAYGLEINGVNASLRQWREILLPLLMPDA